MRVTPGGIVRLEPEAYKQHYNLIARECPESARVLMSVYASDPGSSPTGLVIRKWTREVLTSVAHSSVRATQAQLKVVTYVEVIWPAGRCPQCPIEILVPAS